MDFVLAAFACALSLVVAPVWMVRSKWSDVHPRLAVMWWYVIGALGLAATVTLCWAVVVAPLPDSLWRDVATFLGSIVSHHPLRGLGLSEAIGLTLLTDIALLVVGGLVAGSLLAFRRRRRHREILDLVGEFDSSRNLYVVDHLDPAAYYVPGRQPRVVVSQGLLSLFDAEDVATVIAHEEGHRHGRHGLWLAPLHAVRPFFSFVPYARLAPVAVRAAVEMAADDFAVNTVGAASVSRALQRAHLFVHAPLGAVAWDGSVLDRRIARISTTESRWIEICVAWSAVAVITVMTASAWLAH